MKRRLLAVILALLTVVSLTLCLGGCSGKDDNFPVTVGHTTLKDKPDKVAVLSDNLADMIYYMGYSTQICAVSDSCTQEVLTKYIESVGRETAPDIDGLVRCGTKYVLVDTPLSQTITDKLRSHGIEIVEFMKPSTTQQLATLYNALGKFFGGYPEGKDNGTNAYNRLISTMEQAEKAVEGSTVVKLICYLYLDESNNLCSFNSSSCEGMVLDYVSAANVATNFPNDKVEEGILRLSNPDYIFYDNKEVLTYLKSNSALSSMNALENNRTYILPKENLERLGSSMIETQSFIISKMYPNSVSQNTTGESYASKYGINLNDTLSYKSGDDHEDVKAIQQRLLDLGYLELDGDGATTYFGGKTEAALKSFQAANGLEPSGVADSTTLKLLFLSTTLSVSGQPVNPAQEADEPATTTSTEPATSGNVNTDGYSIDLSAEKSYQSGDEHEDIKAIQQRLEELLYISFSEGDSYTTYFGQGTTNAIYKFQESNDLPATGVADYETLKVLFSDNAKQPN